ncbi:MAG TPA: beta-glucosidase BglX [Terriglobales bacterium]|nr:beta-glucosidase BglX [Terriglobales bacterium]
MVLRWLSSLFLSACLITSLFAQNKSLTTGEVDNRVNQLLSQMTLEEKIGQMTQIPGGFVRGPEKPEDLIRKGIDGSVLWINDPVEMNRMQHIAVEQTRLHIPILFGLDVIHGYRTIFPAPLAMAASWDPKMAEAAQAVAAKEARADGFAWTFAPMVDIARDPRWGRIIEGSGEDPYLGAAMARAQVRGFQGEDNDLSNPDHVLACVKHFAGYGAADGGRDYDSSYIPEDLMWNVYLPPFKAALDAGVGSLMSAYMDLNDVPATGNRWLLHDVLRQTWGFNGFVVSDAQAIGSLVTHGYARDGSDAALKAMNAGVNMDMASFTYYQNLAKLVKAGQISTAEIDAMVRPILAAKIRLGLFEHPYVEPHSQQVAADPHSAELARTAAQRSMVLLRNEGSLLPLAKSGKYSSIAVIGPLADSGDDQLSMWGHIGKPNPPVSVLQGIRNKLGDAVRIEYSKGPNITREYPSFFADALHIHTDPKQTAEEAKKAFDDALATAKRNDMVILVLGEGSIMNGEAASRASLDFVGQQEQLLEAVVATGKPVVLVLINARPINLLWASEHVPAILEAWVPGEQGGNAVADILFGDAVPGGKLPITWPRTVGQIPIYYAHNLTQQHEDAPDFKSRYWDLSSFPLYPFGYGLSYTTFSYSNIHISNPQPGVGSTFEVTADVQNTGSRAGDTVAQLYIHQQAGSASRPVRQLKGFERITLAPGETKTVHFKLGKDELTYWSPSLRKWVEEPEQFDVWVGEDSTAKLHSNFKLID